MESRIAQPAETTSHCQVKLRMGQVIPGFEEALLGMKVNEERRDVTIPPERPTESRQTSNGWPRLSSSS